MDMAMNAVMEPIYRLAIAHGSEPVLPRELEETAAAGFVRSGERLYLARPETTTPPPANVGDFDAEGWVNRLRLDTETPPLEPSWRPEVLRNGLAVAKRLMPKAAALTGLPVQVVISLQSDPGTIDPVCDYACGAVHVRLVRCAQDDMAVGVDRCVQPVLVLTETASSLSDAGIGGG